MTKKCHAPTIPWDIIMGDTKSIHTAPPKPGFVWRWGNPSSSSMVCQCLPIVYQLFINVYHHFSTWNGHLDISLITFHCFLRDNHRPRPTWDSATWCDTPSEAPSPTSLGRWKFRDWTPTGGFPGGNPSHTMGTWEYNGGVYTVYIYIYVYIHMWHGQVAGELVVVIHAMPILLCHRSSCVSSGWSSPVGSGYVWVMAQTQLEHCSVTTVTRFRDEAQYSTNRMVHQNGIPRAAHLEDWDISPKLQKQETKEFSKWRPLQVRIIWSESPKKWTLFGPFVLCQDLISCQTVTGQHQIPPFMVRKSRTAGTSSGK